MTSVAPVILLVAPAGPLRDALSERLGGDVRVVEPGDPGALLQAMRGVERMFLACDDPVAAADAVAAAEMAHVYHCVTLGPIDALSGSSVRWTILLVESEPVEESAIAAAAARALTQDGYENTTIALPELGPDG